MKQSASTLRRMTVHTQVLDPKRIAARVETPKGDVYEVSTESNYRLDPSSTPWVPPTITVGMRHGWNVALDGQVDSTAVAGAADAQKVIAGWYPRHYRKVLLSGDPTSASDQAGGVGCFFSGGVDSFYSAIKEHDRITHLIFVHGFDIKVDDDVLADQALTAAREAAADLGKPLIEVKTTVRTAFGDRLKMQWGEVFHGPCLMHVGLALAPHLRSVLIPSTYSQEELHPWGSHPDLDPLWSSSSVTFVHHELEADRFEKIRTISDSDTAMKHLRVCWMNRSSAFNCGRCPKCIRTKIGLIAAGAESPRLPGAIDPKVVRRMIVTKNERVFLIGALRAMRDSGVDDPPLERALRSAIRRSYFWQFLVR